MRMAQDRALCCSRARCHPASPSAAAGAGAERSRGLLLTAGSGPRLSDQPPFTSADVAACLEDSPELPSGLVWFFFLYLQVTVCGWQSISPLPHKRRQSPGPIASEAAVNMILKLPRFQGSRALEGTVNIVRLAINLQELISLYSQLFK